LAQQGLTKHEAEKNNIEVKTCVTEKKSSARYYPGGFPVYMKLLFEKKFPQAYWSSDRIKRIWY